MKLDRKKILEYFRTLPTYSGCVERCSTMPSRFRPPVADERLDMGSTPVYNGMSLDDIESMSKILRADNLQRIDLERNAIHQGNAILDQMDGKPI